MLNYLFGGMLRTYARNEVKREVEKIRSEMKTQVKEDCVTLINYMFSEEAPSKEWTNYGWGDSCFKTLTAKGVLQQEIADIVIAGMKEEEQVRIDDKLNGEDFIDSIVKRIRDKQIN